MKLTKEQRSHNSRMAWATDPERRRRARLRMRRVWRKPGYRAMRSEQMSQRMQTAAIRRRISKALTRVWRTPRRRQLAALQMKRQWANPKYRRARIASMQGWWRNDATKRRMSRAMKRLWRDPAHRRKMILALTKGWRDPANRRRREAVSKSNFGPSQGARRLHQILGQGWFLELWTPQGFVDIANPVERIAVECDGRDHDKPKQRKRDRQKERGLVRDGWSVYRVCEYKCRALPRRGQPNAND